MHILDPFTGTGTFITRLMQSGLVRPDDLARRYSSELHANEVQELSGRSSCLGRFDHPVDAARAVAGTDAAGWAISEPELVGEPVVALVLRREVGDVDE